MLSVVPDRYGVDVPQLNGPRQRYSEFLGALMLGSEMHVATNSAQLVPTSFQCSFGEHLSTASRASANLRPAMLGNGTWASGRTVRIQEAHGWTFGCFHESNSRVRTARTNPESHMAMQRRSSTAALQHLKRGLFDELSFYIKDTHRSPDALAHLQLLCVARSSW
jgi:hypothetical protein